MKILHFKLKSQKGIGIVELVVSATVLLILSAAVASTIVAVISSNKQNMNIKLANELIQSIMEKEGFSDTDMGTQENLKPSSFVSNFANYDKNFSVDISRSVNTINDTAGVKVETIIVTVYSINRVNDTTVKNKKFISQSVKKIQKDND